ncbi:MAG: bifunctional nuclease family protein [Planctomycetota bacterium]
MPVQMELSRILISETEDTHVLELREVDPIEPGEPRKFPIIIGFNEAAAIERRLMGQIPPRPQTHELLADVIDRLGFRLQEVVVNDLSDHTFFARLHLQSQSDPADLRQIDSRPSDAIALGVATEVPIFVAESVLDEVCRPAT